MLHYLKLQLSNLATMATLDRLLSITGHLTFSPPQGYDAVLAAANTSFPAAPAWKPPFQAALSSQPATLFQIATVAAPGVPRVRTVHFQGFLGESPEPARTTSDLLYFASDSRSNKFADLALSACVEANFMFGATMQQFRVKGRAVAVSPPVLEPVAALEVAARRALERHLGGGTFEGWDWGAEAQRVWDAQNPHVREKYGDTRDVPAEFKLVVVVPEEVEEWAKGETTTWKVSVQGEEATWVQAK